jgi:hypothetical protein
VAKPGLVTLGKGVSKESESEESSGTSGSSGTPSASEPKETVDIVSPRTNNQVAQETERKAFQKPAFRSVKEFKEPAALNETETKEFKNPVRPVKET